MNKKIAESSGSLLLKFSELYNITFIGTALALASDLAIVGMWLFWSNAPVTLPAFILLFVAYGIIARRFYKQWRNIGNVTDAYLESKSESEWVTHQGGKTALRGKFSSFRKNSRVLWAVFIILLITEAVLLFP